jgi:hypothetical protein
MLKTSSNCQHPSQVFKSRALSFESCQLRPASNKQKENINSHAEKKKTKMQGGYKYIINAASLGRIPKQWQLPQGMPIRLKSKFNAASPGASE